MPRCSNAIICFANFLTVLVAASLIYGGLWIKAEANKECQHGLQWIIIISGVALLILSICGILGSCCRLNFFLWIYLFFMFLLIVFTVVAVAFSFAVTNKEVERTVSDFKVGNASTWLHKFATANWGTTVECMKESELCGHRMMMLLNKNNDSAEGQILRRTDLHGIISPIQAGCCMPPGDCGYTHVNETYWEVPEQPSNFPQNSMEQGSISSPPEQHQPLLRSSSGGGGGARSTRVAALLGRAAGRRSGPSALVRETAALQLEERRADWAYSRPVVALDISWNLAFAAVSAVMLAFTMDERPNVPLRVWVAGYALQCAVHVALVWAEYRRRTARRRDGDAEVGVRGDSDAIDSEEDGDERWFRSNHRSSFARRCESLNTMTSFLWWIIGFYWVISGGEFLLQDAPRLYWLTVVFLAFDVFFAIFCVALACVIGVALCCCLPCIIAILYAVAGQEGASDADISVLPRYKYVDSCGNEAKMPVEGTMVPIANNGSSDERVLLREDAECCICLTSYENGTELHALPCNHHFHTSCIVKWLRINATCPLCKYNILKGNDCV